MNSAHYHQLDRDPRRVTIEVTPVRFGERP